MQSRYRQRGGCDLGNHPIVNDALYVDMSAEIAGNAVFFKKRDKLIGVIELIAEGEHIAVGVEILMRYRDNVDALGLRP